MRRNALKGLTGNAPPEPINPGDDKKQEKTEVFSILVNSHQRLTTCQVDEMVERIYANMSACHLKNENWQRALECANKVSVKTKVHLILHIHIDCDFIRPWPRTKITTRRCSVKAKL